MELKKVGDFVHIDDLLVFHCAPTLAGLKMAALVCIPHGNQDAEYKAMVCEYNLRYNSRGLYFTTLCTCKGRHLLYIYRKSEVTAYLESAQVKHFLKAFGYTQNDRFEESLAKLSHRFDSCAEFPHELGLFLGYPLADVQAFIRNKGAGAKLTGEWKVYSDVVFARREFTRYDLCRKVYVNMFNRGYSLERLVIA